MASFEKSQGDTSKKNATVGHIFPLKRYEPAINRFTKVAIPTDLDRLERHKYNIQKFVKWKDWSKFDVERINAERTIKHLKTIVQDMNIIREQVAEDEVQAFDKKVNIASNKALGEINELQELIKSAEDGRDENDGSGEQLSLSPKISDSDFPLVAERSVFPTREADTKKSSPKTHLGRFDVTLHTFTSITTPTALDRMRKHCINMEKYHEEKRWRELNAEQVHAGITVQHLKKSIEEIEVTRNQVPLNELAEFDQRVGPSFDKALAAIDSFMQFQKKYKPTNDVTHIAQNMKEDENVELQTHDKLLNQEFTDPDEATLQSWDNLQTSLLELNEIIHDFSHLVHEQQASVDTITANIEHAQVNIHEATQELGRAAKIQGMLVPVMGAVVGGVVGGPVGMFAGFKAAAVLTAVGGGVIGYGATNYIKNKREAAIDSELEKLKRRTDDGDDSS